MCSDHFISRKKSNLPGLPDFVSSIQTKMLELTRCLSHSEDSYRHFLSARCRARMQEQRSKESEKNRRAAELKQAQLDTIQCAITHDHTYASSSVASERELVSLEELPSEELLTDEEQDQPALQELIVSSDERENENKELSEEPSRQTDDAGISVKVGKTIFNEINALYVYLF